MDFQLHLETESVEQAHPTKPVCVLPSDSIRHVMRVLKSNATSAAMVCREGKLEGIFTERDALRQLAEGKRPGRAGIERNGPSAGFDADE